MLLLAGASVLCIGGANSGKTTMVSQVLGEFGSCCPTPDSMRSHIVSNIIDLIRGVKLSGIPAALETLRLYILPPHNEVLV